MPGQAPGLEGLQQALGIFRATFPDGEITVDDLIIDGNKIEPCNVVRGTHQGDFLGVPATGQPVQMGEIDIWLVEGDLIAEAWHIEELLSALIQIGAMPAPEAPSTSASPVAGQAGGQTIVAAGLTNPRGLAWGPDGALFVALAGAGGSTPGDPPIPPPLGPFMGGPTAAVARIDAGCPVAVATGLPSAQVGTSGAIGIGDLAVLDGQLYALGAGGTKEGGNPGTANALYRTEVDGTATLVADLSAFVLANPPADAPPEGLPNPGNPYAMAVVGDRFWVVDAVLGLILTVTADGTVELLVDVSADHPVPTGIAPAPDGGAYVGYLTELPYPDGAAKVVHISPEGDVTDAWTGLTAVTSVAVGPDGRLYAAELSTGNTDQPPFIVPGTGRLVRQTGPNSLEVVADGLTLPVNVDIGLALRLPRPSRRPRTRPFRSRHSRRDRIRRLTVDAPRFDAFAKRLAVSVPRRRAVKVLAALGLGGILGGAVGRPVAARTVDCPEMNCAECSCQICRITANSCWCWCGSCDIAGIAGGGAVALAGGGEAHLSLLATRTADPTQSDTFVVHGQVRWTDLAWEGAGLTLESTILTFYGPLAEIEGGREAAGWLRTDQHSGSFPFVLRAVDASPPGGGQDTVALWVGDAVLEEPTLAGTPAPDQAPSGFRYVAEGKLAAGDLQLVRLTSETARRHRKRARVMRARSSPFHRRIGCGRRAVSRCD